jgi:hypothetical protein
MRTPPSEPPRPDLRNIVRSREMLPKFAVQVDGDLLNLRLFGFEFGFHSLLSMPHPRS